LTAGCDAAYRSADGLIAQSAGFRSRLVARGVDPARIRVIPNWADESLPEPTLADRAIARQRAGMDVKFTVLFAGTMGTVQALDCVIGAAEILEHRRPEVQFVLVGGGVDVERLKGKAAGRGNVRFLPKCTPGEAQAMTLEADALLVHLKADPLFEVTIPSKTQAYLRSGRPILVGVRGDAAEMVDAAGAGLGFEPESAESLAARVSELASLGRDAIDRMGADGKMYYEKHLSAGIGVSSLEGVLQAAIVLRRGRD
jgi:glycosyltransferase involved in cell wall biosynthesis